MRSERWQKIKGSFGKMVALFELMKIKKQKQVGEREACEFGQHNGQWHCMCRERREEKRREKGRQFTRKMKEKIQ